MTFWPFNFRIGPNVTLFIQYVLLGVPWASPVALVVKNLLANAGDTRDMGLIPGSGRSPGEGHGNPLQYSCLENPMNRGAWQATVHRVAKSQTQLKRLGTCPHTGVLYQNFARKKRQSRCYFKMHWNTQHVKFALHFYIQKMILYFNILSICV